MKNWIARLGLAYCALVWGSTFYLIKDSLAGVEPFALVGYRFLVSAVLLFPWVMMRKSFSRHWKESVWLSLLLTALYLSQTVGLRHTSASNSGFITGLFVLFVPLLLALKGRMPSASQWGATALALIGLWQLTGGTGSLNRGDLLTLVSALTYAAHLLATDKYVRDDADPILLAFHQFWMTGLFALILAAIAGLPLGVRSAQAGGVILFLALIPTVSGFHIQMLAQKVTTPLTVSLIFSLEPLFAALFAWTLGREPFQPARALGGGLILAAMALGELSRLGPLRLRRKEIAPV
ncbi:MAG: DMT family transporter [Elusimicrobia bacterium]|nr:DMT family transporter [Elusimicrobiota bacterium]